MTWSMNGAMGAGFRGRFARLTGAIAAALLLAAPVVALELDLNDPSIEPMPIAIPRFITENPSASELAATLTEVVAQDLVGTGLFREVGEQSHIARITSFDAPVTFADWRAINVEALVTGSVALGADGRLTVKFRLYDVPLGDALEGLQLGGSERDWRRIAHKVADVIYSRITGETGYFDTRVVFVSESGPKDNRAKRLAVMDQDGAEVRYLTDSSAIVIAPRFSPDGGQILFTSFETGFPRIKLMDVATAEARTLSEQAGTMTFAPRFSPDGGSVVFSLDQGGNSDIWRMELGSGASTRLTEAPSIETAPSFSPDGERIVFESDRSGAPQIYVMPTSGGEPERISFGEGRYGTPVWSPKGDYIAFTKQNAGRFHIGVMRVDGSEERLLTASFLDEGPTWAPNGRVIMFTRQSAGAAGEPALLSVDIAGRNPRIIATPGPASDPNWSPLLP